MYFGMPRKTTQIIQIHIHNQFNFCRQNIKNKTFIFIAFARKINEFIETEFRIVFIFSFINSEDIESSLDFGFVRLNKCCFRFTYCVTDIFLSETLQSSMIQKNGVNFFSSVISVNCLHSCHYVTCFDIQHHL